ncbi:hypothetical protein E9840_04600 [Tissierella creatinini]|nr:hypothetical protein E9840_04600 [Tissierella creatinini]TJX60653.1 hypothetical protein E8P77_19905 [Soehngenia saccharolytica]
MNNNNNKGPKCWICNDTGFVTLEKKANQYTYEYAERCTCKEGQKASSKIRSIERELAEIMAMENYIKFNEGK